MSPSDEQLERGRRVLQLLLEVQRELAAGTRPAAIAAALRVSPACVEWALSILADGAAC